MAARWNQIVLPVGRVQDRVDAGVGRARCDREGLIGIVAVHRQPNAIEDCNRRGGRDLAARAAAHPPAVNSEPAHLNGSAWHQAKRALNAFVTVSHPVVGEIAHRAEEQGSGKVV